MTSKGSTAVLARLEALPDGRSMLVLEDMEQLAATDSTLWKRVSLYTSAAIDTTKLKESNLPEQVLSDIGFNVLARLVAVSERDA